MLLLADCGRSNGDRVPLFRQGLYRLSQLLDRTIRVCHLPPYCSDRTIRVCHLPPYCSKYNPIDHRLFCHSSRSLQAIQLTSIKVVYEALRGTATGQGLRVMCELSRKPYPAGIKATAEFLANEPTQRDNNLSACNYKFSPNRNAEVILESSLSTCFVGPRACFYDIASPESCDDTHPAYNAAITT